MLKQEERESARGLESEGIVPMQFRYCPVCGTALDGEYEKGRNYPTCPTGHYTWFPSQVVGVAGVICDGERVLLERRAIAPGLGLWALPGGMAEQGESMEECLAREIWEETGLRVEVGRLLGVRGGQKVCIVFYETAVQGGELTKSDESEELRWFFISELPWHKFAFPRHKETLEQWSRTVKWR